MDNNNGLSKARELYNQIVESFSYKTSDPATHESGALPVSYSEVKYGLATIAEIENLKVSDAEFNAKLAKLKAICTKSLRRKMRPSLAVLIAAVVWVSLNIFMATSNLSDDLNGRYKPAEADKIYNDAIASHSQLIEYYKARPNADDSKKWQDHHSQELKSLRTISPLAYLNQQNQKIKSKAQKKLITAIASVLLLIAYLLSARAPMFLVYNRKKQVELAREKKMSTGILKSVLSALWAIPVPEPRTYRVKTLMSNGTVREENVTETGAGMLIMKYIFILLALIVAFYVMIIALPVLIVFNYLRNYQYVFFNRVSEALFRKKHSTTENAEARVNTKKRKLPVVENYKSGDAVLARYAADNYFYYGTIEYVGDQSLTILYYDGTKEEVQKKDICLLDYAVQNLKAEANWQNKGSYYGCSITGCHAGKFTVKYEDNSTEEVGADQLRFY